MKWTFIVMGLMAAWGDQLLSQEIPGNAGREAAIRKFPSVHERGRNWFDEVDGSLWVRGDDFKASFSSDAVSFIPFLGSDAPRNFPVTFRFESLRSGAELVELANPRPARREGSLIAVDRGAVIEQYVVAPTQVEQLFRIERSPGPGALVVKVAVETELAVSRTPEGALEFANDRGGVRYGRPEVVDASGRRGSMQSAWHDGSIELTIPEAFLAHAVFPVTIDPVLSSFITLSGGPSYPTQDFKPDVAYDLASDLFAIVYEEVYSASDHDIFVLMKDTLASNVVSAYVDFTGSYWAAPKIANNRIAQQFLVVAEKTIGGGATAIFGRTIQPTTPVIAMSAQFQISGSELGLKTHPDVGGDASPFSPTYYCVCWQSTIGSNKNVYYNVVEPNNNLHFGTNPSPFVGYSTLNANSNPSISKSDGDSPSNTQNWIIVFQRTFSATDEDIFGAVIHWDGSIVDPGFVVDNSGLYEANPSVSSVTDQVGGTRRWLAVYEKLIPGVPPFSSPQYDLFGMLFTGTSLITQANLSTLLGSIPSHDQTHACVDTDGTRFSLGFTDSGGFVDLGTPYLATVHVVNGTTLGLTEPPVSINAYPGLDDNMRITSKRSGGGLQYRYMAVHDVQSTMNGGRDVLGALYDGWSPVANGGPAAYLNQVLPGCNGLGLTVQGFPALGLGLNVTLSGVQGTGYIAYGAPISPITLCTGCLLGLDPNTVTVFQATSLSGTIPLEGGLVNVSIAIQGADFGAPGGCPGSPPISLSDCVIVTIL